MLAPLLGALAPPALGAHALLFGATLTEARDFAVDSASARGWTVSALGWTSAEFEQLLETPDIHDPNAPRRLIRISASFSEEAVGTRVELSAREVERPSPDQEWSSDVTERYGQNLMNALDSLRAKWDQRREGAESAPRFDPGHAGPFETQTHSSRAPLGTWAYYAEHYAASRGCELDGAGAVLLASQADWEQHRVLCRDGRSFDVECHLGECASSDASRATMAPAPAPDEAP